MIILITGPFYLILVINIRLNLHKAEKRVSLTLEFNDTIIESQKVTGNKAKHILEDIEIFYRNSFFGSFLVTRQEMNKKKEFNRRY